MIKRFRIFLCLILVSFVLLGVNIYSLSMGKKSVEVLNNVKNSRNSIALSSYRGTIYDNSFTPIAGKEIYNGALIDPLKLNEQDLKFLYENLMFISKDEFESKLNKALPFYVNLKEGYNAKGSISIGTALRYSEQGLAQNLIGFVNSKGEGVGGIEEFFNSELAVNKEYRVHYRADALGQILEGYGLNFSGSAYGADEGIVLSLNKEIQEICEDAALNSFEKGAVLVQEVSSGNILACVSLPTFSPYNIEDSLNTEGAFLNKTLEEFCCGSAFKIVVTAAALENSDEINFSYNCKGSYNAGGVLIGCGNSEGHGLLTLKTAFAKSCNTYFCNIAHQLGYEKLYDMAKKMGFGQSFDLGFGFESKQGVMPSILELSAPAVLANFSIGQGYFTVTPVQVSYMTSIIANNGVAVSPSLILGFTDDGKEFSQMSEKTKERIISQRTAKEIQSLMVYAVNYGTGVNAKPIYGGAGAKTSTAETGIYNGQVQEYHTWVTGFVPSSSPKYIITVLVEGGESGYYNAAPVMKKIADALIAAGKY